MLATPYQDIYLKKVGDVLSSECGVATSVAMVNESRDRLSRWIFMSKDHGVAYHSQPFLTNKFPGTRANVLVMHGIDAGRRDGLGSFAFGAGRTLDSSGNRLYSSLLISSPWTQKLAELEVPAYSGRVFVQGDWRADNLLRLVESPERVRASLGIENSEPTIGLYSTHGIHAAFKWYGDQLVPLLKETSKRANVMIFFHPLERLIQPTLFSRVCQLARETSRIRIVDDAEVESCLSLCDILIGDASSTSLYFSLLGRPIVYCPFDTNSFLPDFPIMSLHNELLRVDHVSDIFEICRDVSRTGETTSFPVPSKAFRERLYPEGVTFASLAPSAIKQSLSLSLLEP